MVRDISLVAMCGQGSLCEAGDAGEDVIGALGPEERRGGGVVAVDEVMNGAFQLGRAAVDAAADLLVGQFREPTFDEIEPGAVGRREMRAEARTLGEPVADRRRLVGSVVV